MAAQGSKGRVKNNENSFTYNIIGALDRDGDRSRRPAAHGHRFGRISGSVFGVKSIKTNLNIEPKLFQNSDTQQLENNVRKNTKMDPKSMPKGVKNIIKRVLNNIMKIIEEQVFLNGKACKINKKTLIFESLQAEYVNGKRNQENIKIDT